MEHAIYEHMAETIQEHRTWVTAELLHKKCPFLVLKNGILCIVYSEPLLLKVYHPKYGYYLNQTWMDPEYKLEATVRQIRKSDRQFWERYKKDKLTLRDIERLVFLATFNVVRLDLDELGSLY